MTATDTELVRRLNLGRADHRAIANKLDGLRAGRTYLPAAAVDALAVIDAEIVDTLAAAEALIAEEAARTAAAPILIADHHGRVIGRRTRRA